MDAETKIAELLGQMTLEEKVTLLAGADMWRTEGVPRLGVPAFKMTDGPNGARGGSFAGGATAVCFPCGTALASTWNPELIGKVGAALAAEARSKAAHVLLGPTVNLHRTPLGGRNFECYSEDPHLTSEIAVAYIEGLQSGGVGACIKHFAANDSEFERHTISSEVDERSLRELYLRPFEAATKRARSWAVMSAYNKLNGSYCSENDWLLNDVLRDEWGFDGVVISDWGGTADTLGIGNHGLDLEMPGPPRHMGDKLLQAVKAGEVPESQIDDKVSRLLRTTIRTGAFEQPVEPDEQAIDLPEHRALARRVAAESVVLMKNEAQLLPLDARQLKSVAILGPNSLDAQIQGGGSAQVQAHYFVDPVEAIHNRLGSSAELRVERGCTSYKGTPPIDVRCLTPSGDGERAGLTIEYFDGLDLSGDPVLVRHASRIYYTWIGAFADEVDSNHFSARLSGRFSAPDTGPFTFSIASAGLSRLKIDGDVVIDNWSEQRPGSSFFSQGSADETGVVQMQAGQSYDLELEYSREGAKFVGGLRLDCQPPVPEDMFERAVEAARDCDAAIVFVGLNDAWESEGHDRADMELPGRSVELIEAVCAANPRTAVVINAGAPITLDWLDSAPAVLDMWYPGQECGNAIADVLFGDVNPAGRLSTTWPIHLEDTPAFAHYPGSDGQVHYEEGVLMGYRHYDTRKIEPRLAFGHGLSYTRFEYSNLQVEADGDGARAVFDLANVGERDGQEVVQVYLHDYESTLERPEQELVAFQKVEIAAGASQRVELSLDRRAFSFYDPEAHGWVAEAGAFEVRVGASSRDLRLRADYRLS
jgi:beta-glucosidase